MSHPWTRRQFLISCPLGVAGLASARSARAAGRRSLGSPEPIGGLKEGIGPAVIPGGRWYEAGAVADGLRYSFEPGTLAGPPLWLTADLLLDGQDLAFELALRARDQGPPFTLTFALLEQCEARARVPTEVTTLNRWQFPREGAWLKPLAGGARVDLAKVDQLVLRVLRKGDSAVRWCMTPLVVATEEPLPLPLPRLPAGPLLDRLGQSRLRDWAGKTRSEAEVTVRLSAQDRAAADQRWPQAFSQWGGWTHRRFEPAGFFRRHHDGSRWWLVDPDGYAFWSAGLDCVRVDTNAAIGGLETAVEWLPPRDGPFSAAWGKNARGESFNYLAANFIRAFGPEDWYARWSRIALAQLRGLGLNTVANWSDWEVASAARFPYVRPLDFGRREAPMVFRDFPDVFDSRFDQDADRLASSLAGSRDDPALIGYFLMNEPTWGFARESPAAGMLFTAPHAASRRALSDWLRRRHQGDAALAEAWEIPVSFGEVAEGEWRRPLTPGAEADLADFSAVMVERYFGTLSRACRRVDANHLNLGIRYYTVPPAWAVEGMKTFDVFSMNCYESRIRSAEMEAVARSLEMPVLVGEWHFGALDVGLPGSGIGRVRSQEDRGRAYRVYLEDAVSKKLTVGVHYFTMYDESALGRFDGENYNIGFFDVCNRPYEPLCTAARQAHERLYEVAAGSLAPFDDAPEYLPKLFL
jgi:hypothetical protein